MTACISTAGALANSHGDEKRSQGPGVLRPRSDPVATQNAGTSTPGMLPIRVGGSSAAILLDLGQDPPAAAVEIRNGRWHVLGQLPTVFNRPRAMLELPTPLGSSLQALRRFVPVASDEEFRLLASVLVSWLFPTGPYPILVLNGPQGSAKSTTSRIIRSLIDPNSAPVRTAPSSQSDLAVMVANSWVIAIDNISNLPPWLSDALCRLSTGGGWVTRKLYSDTEETVIDATRPILLNGIGQIASRSDLIDRSIILNLPPISDTNRKTEEELWELFLQERPMILGALLDAVAHAQKELPDLHLAKLPRMADFAKRASAAAERVGWSKEEFLNAYERMRVRGRESAIASSPIAELIEELLAERGAWEGTATDLLRDLESRRTSGRYDRDWPQNPQQLGAELARIEPHLLSGGISVQHSRTADKSRTRTIKITQGAERDREQRHIDHQSHPTEPRSLRPLRLTDIT